MVEKKELMNLFISTYNGKKYDFSFLNHNSK